MERYFQPEIECASQEQIKAWQDERLVKQVKHVWENVPYYRKKMEEKGVTPDDIKGVDDLHKLPFLTKADLRDAYPYGLLAKPLKDCVRIQSTSGTTGRRVVAFYTQNDEDTQYLAGDGSGDTLYRLVGESNVTTGYKIETSDGSLKIYNVEGKLTTIYINKEQYENPPTDEEVVIQRIDISYNTDGTLSRVDDTYGNYMLFNYLTIANDPTEDQEGIPYLAFINVFKYIPEEDDVQQAEYVEFIYLMMHLNLIIYV